MMIKTCALQKKNELRLRAIMLKRALLPTSFDVTSMGRPNVK